MPKKLKLKKLFEVERVSFFPIYLMDLAATYSVKKLLGISCSPVICRYRGIDAVMYVEKNGWDEVCDVAQNKLLKNNRFFYSVKSGMIKECNKIKKFSDNLLKINPSALSNQALIKIYSDFEKRTLDLRAYAWIPNLVDLGTKSIFEIAEEEIEKQTGQDPQIKTYISKLTSPVGKTQLREHELDLYKIQLFIKNNRLRKWIKEKEVARLIKKHTKKFGWLSYYYIGPAWHEEDIAEILKNNIKLIKNPGEKIKEIETYTKKIIQEKSQLQKMLKLNKNTFLLLNKIEAMIFLKAYRKEFLIYSTYCFEPILREISKRLGFLLSETRFMTKNEIRKYLLKKLQLTNNVRNKIRDRLKNGCISVTIGKESKIYTLKQGGKFLRYIEKENRKKSEQVKGNCAYPGIIKGVARIINLKKQINKIKKGEILVSRATNPDLIIAMQKAAAFVTDEGGITSHAAIVAREMKKPCVIGTKIATKLLNDGDYIEVNANKGTVSLIN